MSPIGRIFLVLNLILAAVFLGWASNALATAEDWKGKHATLQAEMDTKLEEKETELSALQIEKNQLEDQGRTFREERGDFETEVDRLTTELSEKDRLISGLQSEVTKIGATLGDYNTTIQRVIGEKDRAAEEAAAMLAERNEAVATAEEAEQAKRNAEDASREAQALIAQLETMKTDLMRQKSSLETQLDTLVAATGISIGDITSQPKIDGAVLEVRNDLNPGLVVLNVGSSSDVKRGYSFDIFRGGSYIGQVRVEDVQGDYCSALITRVTPGNSISQGDRATTQL